MVNNKLRMECAQEFIAFYRNTKKFDDLAERAKEAGDNELARKSNNVANGIRKVFILNGLIDASSRIK